MSQEKNRFLKIKNFLQEIENEVKDDCSLNFTMDSDGELSLIIIFDSKDYLPEERGIKVDFEDDDFREPQIYEDATMEQIRQYSSMFLEKMKSNQD